MFLFESEQAAVTSSFNHDVIPVSLTSELFCIAALNLLMAAAVGPVKKVKLSVAYVFG